MRPRTASPATFVYLIRAGRRHKIGWSRNPQKRLVQVGGEAVVHLIPSSQAAQIERALHRRFADCALGGEWFDLSPEDIDLICQLGRIDATDDLPAALQPGAPKSKATLYVDIQARTKRRLERAANVEQRKLNTQADIALQAFLDDFEKRHGLPDIDEVAD